MTIDNILPIVFICAISYLVIQVLILVFVAYKNYQDKQITKSLDKYRMKIKPDSKWDKK